MESETDGQVQPPVAVAASAQMRAAREAAGLSLTDVATRTRVPLRHLESLERGDYAALPGVTYCAGFARAYARAVGLDEKALVAQVRAEVDRTGDFTEQYQMYEPADPARVPPRGLAWIAVVIAILLAAGYGLWRMQLNTTPVESDQAPPRVAAPKAAPGPQAPAAASVPAGPVVLTAVDDVWLRIYDTGGKTILQRTLKKGESFTVPEEAANPMILTGRADALAVTVGGRAVPPLGTAERTISDVPISARALLARDSAATGGTVEPVGNEGSPLPVAVPTTAAPVQRPKSSRPSEPTKRAVTRPATVARPTAPVTPPARQTPAPMIHSPPGVATPAPAPAANAAGQ